MSIPILFSSSQEGEVVREHQRGAGLPMSLRLIGHCECLAQWMLDLPPTGPAGHLPPEGGGDGCGLSK